MGTGMADGMTRAEVIARLIELRMDRAAAEASAELLHKALRCFEGQDGEIGARNHR